VPADRRGFSSHDSASLVYVLGVFTLFRIGMTRRFEWLMSATCVLGVISPPGPIFCDVPRSLPTFRPAAADYRLPMLLVTAAVITAGRCPLRERVPTGPSSEALLPQFPPFGDFIGLAAGVEIGH